MSPRFVLLAMKAISSSLIHLFLAAGLTVSAGAGELSLTEFNAADNERLGWSVVDDGVMGGLSKGKVAATDDGSILFSGTLSLENNGGFSSLRTKTVKLDLSDSSGLKMRVKGDGRSYQLRLESDARYRSMEVSFMGEFGTKKGEWIEVNVPFSGLTGSFRGFEVKDAVFNPAKVQRLGLLLADKKPGPFALEVDWIHALSKGDDKNDLVSLAIGDERFSTLVTAVKAAGFVELLQGDGPFTVFAPTNDAFAALPEGTLDSLLKEENREKLQAVLKYHVASGAATLADALKASTVKTVQGEPVSIAFKNGRVRINDAQLLDSDIQASNGIIHAIDSVLLPPESAPESKSIRAVAERAGTFKTLLAAVEAAGLTSLIDKEEGPLTVLAPTDKAFAALPAGTVETLLKPENLEKLKSILAYHVFSGRVSAGDALNAGTASTLNGQKVSFGIKDGLFKVNEATILTADLACDNGVIHVIDAVLLPPAPAASGEAATEKEVVGEVSPMARIEQAIIKGVPLFNKGKAAACADVYQECLTALAADEQLGEKLRKVMVQVIEVARQSHDPEARAWMLRRSLDSTLIYLASSGHGGNEGKLPKDSQ
jgi:transforming growth factor-beta-induced protein